MQQLTRFQQTWSIAWSLCNTWVLVVSKGLLLTFLLGFLLGSGHLHARTKMLRLVQPMNVYCR